MHKTVSLDFETPYDSDFSVKDLGNWHYARDPRCVPYLVSVCDGSESWAGHPNDFRFESLAGHTLVSHHAAFDEEIALASKENGLFEVPGLNPLHMPDWHCTMDMSRYLWNVGSLHDACKAGLGIEVDKSIRDRAKGKSVDDMRREGWYDKMLEYARLDAQYCWQLWDKHAASWPAIERRLSQLTREQGRYGVAIDIPALDKGVEILNTVIFNATNNLPWVQRGRKPGSPIGIAEDCKLAGIPQRPVKVREGEEAYDEWEEKYAGNYPFVMSLRNLRRGEKMLATLETIKKRLRPDGTAFFSLRYCGAHSRRWSGSGGWNLQNPNKEPLFINAANSFVYDKKKVAQLAKEFKEKKEDVAVGVLESGYTFVDLRGLIIARPGKVLCPVDLAQIEPRVLNWLAGNWSLLKKISEGMGIYEGFARESLDWKGGKLKDEDPKLYALSKADVLGLGFGAAWEKFITVAWTMAQVDITEGDEEFAVQYSVDNKIHQRYKMDKIYVYLSAPETADVKRHALGTEMPSCEPCCFIIKKKFKNKEPIDVMVGVGVYGMRSRITVEQFRRANKEFCCRLWKELDLAFKASEGGDFSMELPNGDKMIYRDVRKGRQKKIDPDTGEEYEMNSYSALIGGKRKSTHGSKLCENSTQATARHAFAERLLELHKPEEGRFVLFTAHDEAIPEVDPDTDPREIEKIMSVCPEWLAGCPIAAEAKISKRYLK
jgi:hypothetical protein